MFKITELSLGPSAGALMLFWFLNVLLAGTSVFIQKKPWSIHFDRAAYWSLALALISFTMIRPFGIAPDDAAYLEIYKGICPAADCQQWIQGVRDWGWYSSVGLLKNLWDTPRILLVVAGIATAIKLWVIFRLSSRPLWALLLFVPTFYLVQDITAFRVSMALAFFMLSIYWLSRSYRAIGVFATLLPGFIHLQAVMSPMILFAKILQYRYYIFAMLACVPVGLTLIGLSPILYKSNIASLNFLTIYPPLKDAVTLYTAITHVKGYQTIRVLPYSYIPLVLLVVGLSIDVFKDNKNLYIYCAISFVIACWSLWVFAGWQEPQVRFFEYFALPAVLLVGNLKASWFRFLSVVLVSMVFVVRYNVLHPLLLG